MPGHAPPTSITAFSVRGLLGTSVTVTRFCRALSASSSARKLSACIDPSAPRILSKPSASARTSPSGVEPSKRHPAPRLPLQPARANLRAPPSPSTTSFARSVERYGTNTRDRSDSTRMSSAAASCAVITNTPSPVSQYRASFGVGAVPPTATRYVFGPISIVTTVSGFASPSSPSPRASSDTRRSNVAYSSVPSS